MDRDIALEGDPHIERQGAGREVVGQSGDGLDLAEVSGTGRVEEHRAGDPAEPPLVLILHEVRVGPLDHGQVEGVRAGPQVWREIELRGEVGILADPDIATVDGDDEDALGGPDVENDTPIRPGRWDLEVAAVVAGRVMGRDVRRQFRVRHPDVGVMRQVAEILTGLLHVPGARHGDRRPGGRVLVRLYVRTRCELEPPFAIEVESVRMRDAVHLEPARARQLGRRPGGSHDRILSRQPTSCVAARIGGQVPGGGPKSTSSQESSAEGGAVGAPRRTAAEPGASDASGGAFGSSVKA